MLWSEMDYCRRLKWLFAFFIFGFYIVIVLAGKNVVSIEPTSDADHYHRYAVGLTDQAYNNWPQLLRLLEQFGFYNRRLVSLFLFVVFLMVSLLLPILFMLNPEKGIEVETDVRDVQCLASIVLLLYPSFFWFTTDVFRDVFMVGVFITAIYAKQAFCESSHSVVRLVQLGVFFSLCFYLYLLRPYLGFALALASFFPWRVDGKNIYILVVLGLIVLVISRHFGLLDPVILYRGDSGFKTGGSTLEIGIVNLYGVDFLMAVAKSLGLQLFGLKLNSLKAIFVFVCETVPFCLLLSYVFRNRNHMDNLCLHLFYFSVIYAVIWVLGNDNLGTAVRLRIFNYISILIIALRVYSIKSLGWERIQR